MRVQLEWLAGSAIALTLGQHPQGSLSYPSCIQNIMKIKGKHYRTIWIEDQVVSIIDQRKLPFEFATVKIKSSKEMARAIKEMYVRGAGLIGAAAGFGMYLGAMEYRGHQYKSYLKDCADLLKSTRPTAVNLSWAVNRQLSIALASTNLPACRSIMLSSAMQIAEEDAAACRMIGKHGAEMIAQIAKSKGEPVNILTHCNAGWLAFVDYGTATGPIYHAFDNGIDVHVWVDETRPRNQGARLTAWELAEHGVPHTLIVDNAGGLLMKQGQVDMVLTGADRVARNGDVANKIGTYLKALAARDNNIPFYVALPSTSIDTSLPSGDLIPIEERDQEEILFICDEKAKVQISYDGCPTKNPGFDITPAHLVTGLITETGFYNAEEKSILAAST